MTEHKILILVVEDESLVRLCAIGLLQDAGFDVIESASGDDALHILEHRSDISALFSDINMPGRLDGIALATEVRRRWPGLPIILTSGKTLPEIASVFADEFVSKPYSPDAVVFALEHCLKSGSVQH